MSSSHHLSKRGFTLVELTLIVIIVFVLCAVLFPVFAKRRGSRQSSCSSNQKQIALGFLQYIQDYDEYFPPAVGYAELEDLPAPRNTSREIVMQNWGSGRKLPDGRYVPGILSPYVKSDRLFTDPHVDHTRRETFVLDYMYNDLLAGVDFAMLPGVARTVLTTDAESRLGNAGHALILNAKLYDARFNKKGGCDAGQGASIGSARLRHSNGANFAFADGRVKWLRGGTDDRVFFPPRESASISAVDPQTKRQIGPKPGKDMAYNGRNYDATFHVK